ncbi:hypothetical protein EV700_1798 [Fluviicoccus keumensis]|uniref:Uncharacterized protein n=1 Tax=Fluviicoccus keumensis TaxID=1435465 RepID=A0A4Q7Z5A1_9GAMM|nr:hypothetical protein [Fluviicoccus keumensis]RZU44991.1 hypothetical protein EV700_1798 [Fluviicoccus keumensis]
MSVDVFLWDPSTSGGIPSGFEEAFALVHELMVTAAPTNPKFVAFAEHLLATLQAQREPDDALLDYYRDVVEWASGVCRAVFNPGLGGDGVTALRLVVECAAERGLPVMYGPMGTIFLPDGRTYPSDHRALFEAAWQEADALTKGFPKGLKAFKEHVNSVVRNMAMRHGFRPGKVPYSSRIQSLNNSKGFIREVDFGQQYFYLLIEPAGGAYSITIQTLFYNKWYRNIVGMFDFPSSNSSGDIFYFTGRMIRDFECDENKSIYANEDLSIFFSELEKIYFPLLDEIRTLSDVDAIFNGSFRSRFLDYFLYPYPAKLITAKMTGNPDFEKYVEIATAASERGNTGWMGGGDDKTYKSELPKLIDYLRAGLE